MPSESPACPFARIGTALLSVALMLAVVGVLFIASRAGGSQPGAGAPASVLGAPMYISTSKPTALMCPSGASFSPDGAHIAVLGRLDRCALASAASPTSAVAVVYDSVSGVMTQFVRLDPLLGIGTTASGRQAIRAVSYYSLGWSPDNIHVAIVYTAFSSPRAVSPDTVVDAGLLLLDSRDGSARVLHGDSGYFSAPDGFGGGFPIWNVKTGEELPAFQPDAGLAYAWGNKSQPYPILKVRGPVRELPVGAGARYPVGNPDGGSTFTMWQPGLVAGPGSAGGAGMFAAAFPTWSADGSYVTLLAAGARLPVPRNLPAADSDPATGPAYSTPQPVSAPARDAALDAVQREVGVNGWAFVAWNPNGTLLASVNCFATDGPTLTLRDTASGTTRGTATLLATNPSAPIDAPLEATACRDFPTDTPGGAYPTPPIEVRWSPDGNRVLVADRNGGMLTLWDITPLAR